MPKYTVSERPVRSLAPFEIKAEAKELRLQISIVQGELSKGRAWANAESREKTQQHLEWLARTRTLHGKLQNRYAEIRAAEKEINAGEHEHGQPSKATAR